MAPVKFDDIQKVAKDLLDEDYQTSGYKLKAKQKTGFDAAVVTTDVDLFAKGDTKTPAKLTWKFPAPLGCKSVAVDKLEIDKAGKMKLELSSDQVYSGLKLDAKSDLADFNKITVGATITSIKDTQVKVETKATSPADFSFEATRFQEPGLTFGLKATAATLAAPSVGVRYQNGPLFGSVLATDAFKVYTAHLAYEASKDIKVAATYTHGGKADGSFTAGLRYQAAANLAVKAKIHQDQSLEIGLKRELSKGFSVLGGGKFSAKGDYTYGLQLSIE